MHLAAGEAIALPRPSSRYKGERKGRGRKGLEIGKEKEGEGKDVKGKEIHCVPIKTSTFYFMNNSFQNQVI